MLQRVRFENYRCLRDVTLTLEPFTVLVGANGVGKSSILRGVAPAELKPSDRWGHQGANPSIQFFYADGSNHTYKQTRSRTIGLNQAGIHKATLLHLDLNLLRAPNQLAAQASLAMDGGNLANVFATLSRSMQSELVQQFCTLVPMFSDVNLRPTAAGHHAFVFEDRWSKALLEPREVSDGTMLMLAYLVARHQEAQVDLLAIEEPERGLHPYLMGELVRMFHDMAAGRGGKPVQVVVATHSAELLDHVEPHEVRFLSRDATTGDVSIERADESETSLQAAFREYQGSLGSLWLSGGLGGVPGG